MPLRCAFCGTRTQSFEPHLCAGCLQDLPWRKELCSAAAAPLSVIAAPLQYAFPVDVALKALKFRRRLDYVPGMAGLLCRSVAQLPLGIDALLPMPLHWQRQLMRGFNQAYELARPVQRSTALPLLQHVRRVRATPFQSGLDAVERRRNLRDAFVATEPITAQHVLIIDDVITTGESCRRLAKVVLAAGAKQVSALAVART